jgi:hypothetical protein
MPVVVVEPLKPARSSGLTDVASNARFTKRFAPFGVGDDEDTPAASTFTVTAMTPNWYCPRRPWPSL